jgi:hypothetical protein
MDWKDALTLGTAIVTSLGGGGAIVLGLSGYLGRRWADRALEKDRSEYGQLKSKLEADLRNASQFLQAELDKLTLIHKLRTEGEFQRLATMWKNFANLRSAFASLPHLGHQPVPRDANQRALYVGERRDEFRRATASTQQSFYEEMVFIPKRIADLAQDTLQLAQKENTIHRTRDDQSAYETLSRATFDEFNKQMTSLEKAIREHIHDASDKIEGRAIGTAWKSDSG